MLDNNFLYTFKVPENLPLFWSGSGSVGKRWCHVFPYTSLEMYKFESEFFSLPLTFIGAYLIINIQVAVMVSFVNAKT